MSLRAPARSLARMALVFRSGVARRSAATRRLLLPPGLASRYLTDGRNLFRCLGAIPGAMGQMVGLEDCRSLEVVLVPIGEVHARRLRAVVPSADA